MSRIRIKQDSPIKGFPVTIEGKKEDYFESVSVIKEFKYHKNMVVTCEFIEPSFIISHSWDNTLFVCDFANKNNPVIQKFESMGNCLNRGVRKLNRNTFIAPKSSNNLQSFSIDIIQKKVQMEKNFSIENIRGFQVVSEDEFLVITDHKFLFYSHSKEKLLHSSDIAQKLNQKRHIYAFCRTKRMKNCVFFATDDKVFLFDFMEEIVKLEIKVRSYVSEMRSYIDEENQEILLVGGETSDNTLLYDMKGKLIKEIVSNAQQRSINILGNKYLICGTNSSKGNLQIFDLHSPKKGFLFNKTLFKQGIRDMRIMKMKERTGLVDVCFVACSNDKKVYVIEIKGMKHISHLVRNKFEIQDLDERIQFLRSEEIFYDDEEEKELLFQIKLQNQTFAPTLKLLFL